MGNDKNKEIALRFIRSLVVSFVICIVTIILYLFLPSNDGFGGLQIFSGITTITIDAVTLCFVLFLSCIVVRNLWVRIFKKRTAKFQLYMAVFCITFWCLLFFGSPGGRYGQIRIFSEDFLWKNEVYHITRIRQCLADNGGDAHDCDNKLILRKAGSNRLNIIKTVPRGREMKFHNGLLYFHQEGCCDVGDLVTALDFNGKIVKQCELPRLARFICHHRLDFDEKIVKLCEGNGALGAIPDKMWEKLYACNPSIKEEW